MNMENGEKRPRPIPQVLEMSCRLKAKRDRGLPGLNVAAGNSAGPVPKPTPNPEIIGAEIHPRAHSPRQPCAYLRFGAVGCLRLRMKAIKSSVSASGIIRLGISL